MVHESQDKRQPDLVYTLNKVATLVEAPKVDSQENKIDEIKESEETTVETPREETREKREVKARKSKDSSSSESNSKESDEKQIPALEVDEEKIEATTLALEQFKL